MGKKMALTILESEQKSKTADEDLPTGDVDWKSEIRKSQDPLKNSAEEGCLRRMWLLSIVASATSALIYFNVHALQTRELVANAHFYSMLGYFSGAFLGLTLLSVLLPAVPAVIVWLLARMLKTLGVFAFTRIYWFFWGALFITSTLGGALMPLEPR